ncbi:hypothetical protein HYY74_05605 [Candidatus Woesearchaeota archaeon]|nr:hypothetical protein [Candidatus Woesearchaeota archaeon]
MERRKINGEALFDYLDRIFPSTSPSFKVPLAIWNKAQRGDWAAVDKYLSSQRLKQ